MVGPQLRLAFLAGFRVTGVTQVVGNFFHVCLLAHADGTRLRVNLRRIGEDAAAHFRVHQLRVLDVVKGEDPEQHGADDEECRCAGADKRVLQAVMEAFAARNCYFDRHVLRRKPPSILSDAGRARALPAGTEKYIPDHYSWSSAELAGKETIRPAQKDRRQGRLATNWAAGGPPRQLPNALLCELAVKSRSTG